MIRRSDGPLSCEFDNLHRHGGMTSRLVDRYQRAVRRFEPSDPRRYQWHGYSHAEIHAIWAELVELIPSDHKLRVLELGCGGGELASLVRQRRPNVRCVLPRAWFMFGARMRMACT